MKRILNPEEGIDKNYWKSANWTVVFVCPFSVLGENNGRIEFNFEARYGSHSDDGRIWSFGNREGIRLKSKNNYFKVAIDTPQDIIQWEVNARQYTCEVGLLPYTHTNLASCLSENYGNNLQNFLKTNIEKI